MGGFPEGAAEFRVRFVVGADVFDIGHLDDEEDIGAVARPGGFGQAPDVFGSPLCGGVGEGADAVLFQCTALDLQKAPFAVLDKGKIVAGVAVFDLGAELGDLPQAAVAQPLPCRFVGGLGVHVDEPVALLDGDQVEFGFPVWIVGPLAPDGAAGDQELPAPARVLHMADLHSSIDLDVGNEAVGAGAEDAGGHVFIAHGGPPFGDSCQGTYCEVPSATHARRHFTIRSITSRTEGVLIVP